MTSVEGACVDSGTMPASECGVARLVRTVKRRERGKIDGDADRN